MDIFNKILFYTYHKSFIQKRMRNMRASLREMDEILNKEA